MAHAGVFNPRFPRRCAHGQLFRFCRNEHQVHEVLSQRHSGSPCITRSKVASGGVYSTGLLESVLMGNFFSHHGIFRVAYLAPASGMCGTLGGLGGWPNVIFVEFLARHMVRPVSSLGASSRSLPPGHFRVAYLAPASGMCGPSVASGCGPSCIFNASGRESEKNYLEQSAQ